MNPSKRKEHFNRKPGCIVASGQMSLKGDMKYSDDKKLKFRISSSDSVTLEVTCNG